MAELRSGGQIDSGSGRAYFQITNGHLGEQLPCLPLFRFQFGDLIFGRLFKLNTEAYPASANAQDSLSDGYLAAGKNELALAAEQKCLELLPADTNSAQFKTQLEEAAKDKIAKLKSEQR